MVLPQDSYLARYYSDLAKYLEIGPPVYFVSKGTDSIEDQSKICARSPSCNRFSIANLIEMERKRPEISFIAQPAAVWVDDFFHWLNPDIGCCRLNDQDQLCDVFEEDCRDCLPKWNASLASVPQAEYPALLERWLSAEPNEQCPLAGKPYRNAISSQYSNIRTYHTVLKTQEDYIESMKAAMRISRDASQQTGQEIFAYSPFYVFFEQYLTIKQQSLRLVSMALFGVFVMSWIVTKSWRTATCIAVCVGGSVLGVAGALAALDIRLNALAVVNLAAGVGISTEFMVHMANAFHAAQGGRNARTTTAIISTTGSTLRGIIGTKIVGLGVLTYAHSEIILTYYFMMYALLILLGAAHGLILLPVLLSLFGGDGPMKIALVRGSLMLEDDDDEDEMDSDARVVVTH